MTTRFARLMAMNPTHIGNVMGIDFYEHPTYGGDTGMVACYKEEAVCTDWFDLPEPYDIVGGPDNFMGIYR